MLLFQFFSLLVDFIHRFYLLKLCENFRFELHNLLELHIIIEFSRDRQKFIKSNKNSLFLRLKTSWTWTQLSTFGFWCCRPWPVELLTQADWRTDVASQDFRRLLLWVCWEISLSAVAPWNELRVKSCFIHLLLQGLFSQLIQFLISPITVILHSLYEIMKTTAFLFSLQSNAFQSVVRLCLLMWRVK